MGSSNNRARIESVRPVLPCRDVGQAIEYYVERLGFELRFTDTPSGSSTPPTYAGVVRDTTALHLQWHDETTWDVTEKLSLRFVVNDVDRLFDEYREVAVFHEQTTLRDTPWGTREFAFYDLNQNGLTFYRDLH